MRELDLFGNGLPLLNPLFPWERFRPIQESIPKVKAKGPDGRKPYDWILLFKMMVLQQLHNLSDEQTKYQIRNRLSFRRLLRIGLEEAVPNYTTLSLSDGRLLHLSSNELSKSELLKRYCIRFSINDYCVPNECLPELSGFKDKV